MKQYIIDEIRLNDYSNIKTYLNKNFTKLCMDGLYSVELEYILFSNIQKKHNKCAPFYFTLNLKEDKLCCELLVRSINQVNCSCMGYANIKQRNWIIKIIDGIFEKLEIIS